MCGSIFKRSGRLFDEPVVFDVSEAEDFLRNVLHSIARILRN